MKPLHRKSQKILSRQTLRGEEGAMELGERILFYARQGKNPLDIIPDPDLKDLYLEQMTQALGQWCAKRQGWLYLCSHPMQKEAWKFGSTQKGAQERARSLRTAGVLGEFVVVREWPVWDAFGLEASVKKGLHENFQGQREIFLGEEEKITSFIQSRLDQERETLEKLFHLSSLWKSEALTKGSPRP